ncbi:unnamed protein product [Polarella glacialis]|uniref:Uncharacterized protein n=1 Tax=Polarella glacialis TaxID=89957 RepID=A0A813HKB0_POLGL|nr:unnamed protein product [Polarella glacialis]
MVMAPTRRPLAIPGLLCAAGLASLLLIGLRTSLETPAFTVTSLPPAGFAMEPQASRVEEPLRPLEPLDSEVVFGAGQLGSSCGELPSGSVMSKSRNAGNKADFLYNKDRGYQVGEEAYQHPPAVPDRFSGVNYPSTYSSHCERVYKHCYMVCRRLRFASHRRKDDCKFECFRKRRTCFWQARPASIKIHPNFRKDSTTQA